MSELYQAVLKRVMQTSGRVPIAGTTLLVVWRDRAHFDEWTVLDPNRCDSTQAVRMVTMPSALLPNETTYDKSAIGVVGVAFGIAADYSDVRLMYQMEIAIHG